MAINVDYGSIAGALGLAQQAGKNQGDQQRFRNFIQFSDLTNAAQAELDRRNSMQIQNALASQGLQERYATTEDQISAENQRSIAQQAMAQQQFNANNQYRADMYGLRSEQTANQEDYRNTRAKQFQTQVDRLTTNDQTKQQAIAQLPPDQQAAVQATGRLPYAANPHNFSPNSDDNLEIRLRDQLQRAVNEEGKHAYDPNDLSKIGSQESKSVPGAIAGREARYVAAQQSIAAIHAQMDALQQRRTAVAPNPMQGAPAPAGMGPQQGQAAQPPQSGPGSQTMPVHISNAQDYAQLPSGAYYIDPQGQQRQKA